MIYNFLFYYTLEKFSTNYGSVVSMNFKVRQNYVLYILCVRTTPDNQRYQGKLWMEKYHCGFCTWQACAF